MRTKAEQRLRAALAPPLLDIDANEVFEAATEGEEAELAANMIQQARARAQEAIDAQRLAREEEERRKARRIVAARSLETLSKPAPLQEIFCSSTFQRPAHAWGGGMRGSGPTVLFLEGAACLCRFRRRIASLRFDCAIRCWVFHFPDVTFLEGSLSWLPWNSICRSCFPCGHASCLRVLPPSPKLI